MLFEDHINYDWITPVQYKNIFQILSTKNNCDFITKHIGMNKNVHTHYLTLTVQNDIKVRVVQIRSHRSQVLEFTFFLSNSKHFNTNHTIIENLLLLTFKWILTRNSFKKKVLAKKLAFVPSYFSGKVIIRLSTAHHNEHNILGGLIRFYGQDGRKI